MRTDGKRTDDNQRADAAAVSLLADVASDEWGQVAVSCYDTGRLVALAPWLAGHTARIDFLCGRQAADGSWGGRDGYELVPTMSVTAGLLTELGRTASRGQRRRLARTITGGLAALHRLLDSGARVPDTIGVELIVPALLEELNGLLHRAKDDPYLVDVGAERRSLPLPAGFDRQLLDRARDRLAARDLPRRAWACLEIFGLNAVAAPSVRPAGGAVGCSAAATAAWLGGASGDREALDFLETLQARGGGPVPGVSPISYFEPAWVLNSLAVGGFAPAVPPVLLQRLESGLTPDGAPAAPGLPPDADDTAAVLSALLRHGRLWGPDSLLSFQADGYFRCFLDERNPSVSTNAHVLETLALYLTHHPDQGNRYGPAAAMTADWLRDHQQPDGCWWDKWHASPYYATACCVEALLLHDGGGARAAIDRAVTWVLDSQQPDGSWGRWTGSVEETAYAVQILAKAARRDATTTAIARGAAYLADPPPMAEHPPLWHAKDLYTPVAVVRAARLGALRLATPAAIPQQRSAAGRESRARR